MVADVTKPIAAFPIMTPASHDGTPYSRKNPVVTKSDDIAAAVQAARDDLQRLILVELMTISQLLRIGLHIPESVEDLRREQAVDVELPTAGSS